MEQRMAKLRARLEEAKLDAYFNVAPPNTQYLTGFRGSSSAVVVTDADARFLCDFRYAEQAEEQVQGFEIEVVSGDMMTRVGERLETLGARSTAFEPDYLRVSELHSLEEAFPGRVAPISDLVAGLRLTKSQDEIDRIRDALRLSEGVLEDLVGTLETGLPERELAAQFEYEFKKRGASGASFHPIALFGPRSSLPHGEAGDRRLTSGDVVLLDFGCVLDGYCSDLTRTYAFDTIPGAWFEEIYDLTLTAQRISIEAVRPGMTCRELDAVGRDLIAEAGHGDHFGHGLGHGLGIEIHEAPRLNPQSATVLQPGMVVTIEPGVYLPGRGGIRIEDVVTVTEDGCAVLSSAPKDCRILE